MAEAVWLFANPKHFEIIHFDIEAITSKDTLKRLVLLKKELKQAISSISSTKIAIEKEMSLQDIHLVITEPMQRSTYLIDMRSFVGAFLKHKKQYTGEVIKITNTLMARALLSYLMRLKHIIKKAKRQMYIYR